MENRIAMNGRKLFSGAVVTTQIVKNESHGKDENIIIRVKGKIIKIGKLKCNTTQNLFVSSVTKLHILFEIKFFLVMFLFSSNSPMCAKFGNNNLYNL